MTAITVLHLYPRELGINGDVGNVLALRRRAEWCGAEVRVVDHAPGDALPETVHLVHIGSGPLAAQREVLPDVRRIAPRLREWAAGGVPVLAIAAGWQLLGTSLDGDEMAGVLPTRATLGERVVGEVAGESALGEVAGFVNHAATTVLDAGESLVRFSGGSTEGVVVGDAIGTNLHGPFLPMNPGWADRLLKAAATRAGAVLGTPDERIARADDHARRARDAIRHRLGR